MSKVIDERVVEMRFDNRQFEQNVRTSMATVEKMKKGLDLSGTAKNFENLNASVKKVDFSHMTNGLEAVKVKFSALQVIGMTTLSNITNAVIDSARQIKGKIEDAIVGGGTRRAFNIENAHFMLQGLLKDEEKVQKVMDDAMWSVDGTAYAYDEAAKAASQFAASGLESGEQMRQALRAITGVAAMTNSEYEGISRIFTAVAGQGRLMGDQLLQLSSRGMNAAATLANYLHTTEKDVREMVSSGDISFEMFAAAMDDAFGEHAKKANETFTGAMANMKSALARIGAEFISPLIVQNGPLVDLFNTLREKINGIKSNIGPLANIFVTEVIQITKYVDNLIQKIDTSTKIDWWDPIRVIFNLIDSGKNIFKAFLSVLKPVKKAFKEIVPAPSIKSLIDISAKIKDLTSKMILSNKKADQLKRTFKGLFAIIDMTASIIRGGLQIGLTLIGKLFGETNLNILDTTASLGDMLVSMNEWMKQNNVVSKTVNKVITVVSKAGSAVKAFKDYILGIPAVNKAIQTFEQVLHTAFGNAKTFFAEGLVRISEFIDRVKDIDSLSLDNLKAVFEDFYNNVVKYFITLGGTFDDFNSAFASLKNNVGKVLSSIGFGFDEAGDKVQSFGEAIKNKIPNVNFGSLFAIGAGVGLINMLKKLDKTITKFTAPLFSISGVLGGLKSVLVAYSQEIKSKKLLITAKAIAVLAGSVALLTIVPQDNLWRAVGAISVLTTVLFAFTALSSLLPGASKTLTVTGRGLIGVSAAMLIVVETLREMEKLDLGKLKSNLMILAELTAGLIGVMIALTVISVPLAKSGASLKGAAFAIIAYAASLKLVVDTLKDLESLDIDKLPEMLAGIAIAVGALSIVLLASKGISAKAGIGVLGMAVSLKIMISVLDDICNIDTEKIKNNLGKFIGLFAVFALVMAASHLAGEHALQAGVGILAMTLAIGLIVKAINALGDMSSKTIMKGIVVVGALFTLFGVIVALSHFSGANAAKAGAMILMMSGSLILISTAIGVLAMIDGSGLARATASILFLLGAYALIIAATKGMGSGKDVQKTLLMMSVTIGILAIALAGLAMIDSNNLKAASIALGVTMGVLALFVVVMSAINKLGGIMPTTLIAVGVMGLVLAGLSYAVYQLAQLPIQNVLGSAKSLAVLLASLSVSLILLSLLGPAAIPGAIVAVGALAIFLGGVVGIIFLMSKLADNMDSIEAGIAVLEKIGYGLGAVIGGFAAGLTAGLPDIGKNLSGFMTNAEDFFDGMRMVDPGLVGTVKNLSEALILLTATDLLQRLFKTDFSEFGATILPLGKGITAFVDTIKDLSQESIEKIELASKAILTLAEAAKKIPNSGGLLGGILGNNDVDEWGKQLPKLGRGLVSFGAVVKDLDKTMLKGIENAGKAIETMALAADKIPNSGGLLGGILGNNDVDEWGKQLPKLGRGLMLFANSVENLDDGKIQGINNARSAITLLSIMSDSLPNSGGLLGGIVGNNDMDTWGEQLQKLGFSLSRFAVSCAAIGDDGLAKITSASTAIRSIVDMSTIIAENGNFNFDSLGRQLKSFGESIVDYGKKVRKLDDAMIEGMARSVKASRSLLIVLSNMPERNTSYNIGTFGNQLASYGKALLQFGKEVVKIDTGSVECIQMLSDAATKISEVKYKEFSAFGVKLALFGTNVGMYGDTVGKRLDTLKNVNSYILNLKNVMSQVATIDDKGLSAMEKSINKMTDLISKGFKVDTATINNSGITMITELSKGIESQKDSAIASVKSVVDAAIESMKLERTSFYGTAAYLVTGFIEGINDHITNVAQKSREMAKAADEAARKELDVHSPSKKFYKIGTFVVEGFVNGIAVKTSLIKKTLKKTFVQEVGTVVKDFGEIYNETLSILGDTKPAKTAKKAVSDFGKALYQQTDAYKQSKSAIKEYQKELKKLKKQQSNLKEKEQTKETAKKLKDVEKNIKAVNENIKKEQKKALEDSQKAFMDYYDKIKENVSSTLNFLKQSLDTQVDLFKASNDAQIDLFSEFEMDTEVTTESILHNMKSQVEGVKQWNDNLNALAERGIATGLLDELKELGPSGASYVQAFIDMTKEELEEANDLYGTSAKMSVDVFIKNMESELNAAGELSKRISQLAAKGFNNNVITELKNLGPEASGYIATFMNMSSDEITKTNSMFDRKVAMVGETLLANMEAQLSSVKEWTTDMATLATKGLDGALLKQLGEMGLEGAEYVKAFLNMTTEEMSKVNALYTDSLSLPNTVASSIIASFSYAGTNAAKGFVKGIKDKTPSVAETAEKMATSALKAIKKKLGIHSPSKEFEKLGKYSDTGYVNGLKLYANKVNEAAEDVGNGALDSLRDSIAKISMYVDDGIDSNPVIRPVVDLSNVETGSKQINAMMSRQQSLQIGASMQSKWNSSSVPTSNTTNNNYQFTQNNYSPKALSRTEIYRQTRNQFSAMKGVMNS